MERNAKATGSCPVRLLRAAFAGGALLFVFLDLAFRNQSDSLGDFGGLSWARGVTTPCELFVNLFFLGVAILMVTGWRLLRGTAPTESAGPSERDADVERWCALNASACIAAASFILAWGYALAYHRVVARSYFGGLSPFHLALPGVALMTTHLTVLFLFALLGASVFVFALGETCHPGRGILPARCPEGSAGGLLRSVLSGASTVFAGAWILPAVMDLLLRCTLILAAPKSGGLGSPSIKHCLAPIFHNIFLFVSLAACAGWIILQKARSRMHGAPIRNRPAFERWGLLAACAYAVTVCFSDFWMEILSIRSWFWHKRLAATFPSSDAIYPSKTALMMRLAVPAVLGLAAICLLVYVIRLFRSRKAKPSPSRRTTPDLV